MSISSSPSAPSTLVGRDRELGVLRERLDAALAGHGGLVLIGGEAGIGKTALTEQLCQEAATRNVLILIGRCYDLTDTPPYGPWVELVGCYRPTEDMPALPPAFAQRGIIGATSSQAALFQQVTGFFRAVAASSPLVLVLDDLHWSDPASLDLLRFLIRAVAELPILLLVAYRAEEVTRGRPLYALLPTIVHESNPARLDLRPLDLRAQYALLDRRYHLGPADSDRLIAYLQERTEGNPLFLGEILRTLEEGGTLRLVDDGWAVGDLRQVRVPPLLQQIIDGRVARLGEDAQRLLAIAAVIGYEVPFDLWTTVAACDEDALLMLAERGLDARLLSEGTSDDRIRFAHALIRASLYEQIPGIRRRHVHRHVGEALAASSTPDPDAIAYHFQLAGDARAGEWFVRAGTRAQQASAWLSAAERFETALSLMDTTETSAGKRGWLLFSVARMRRQADPQHSIRCLDEAAECAASARDHLLAAYIACQRGLLHCIVGEIRRGLTELESGIAARQAIAVEGRAPPADLPHDPRPDDDNGRDTLVLWLATAGRFAEARALGEQLSGTLAATARGLGMAYAALGLPDEARGAFARGREACREIGDYYSAGSSAAYDLLWVTLPYHTDQLVRRDALLEAIVDEWKRASGSVQEDLRHLAHLPLALVEGPWVAVQEMARLRADVLGWLRLSVCGQVAYWQGDPDMAWAIVREVLPDGPQTEPGDCRFLVALPLLRLAAALSLDRNDRNATRAWLEAHDRWLAWSDAVLGRADGALAWASFSRAAGDVLAALRFATDALSLASTPRQPLALLAAHRLLGELDTDAGMLDDARQHLAIALTLADACAAPYERALTLLALAELHAATGKITEASRSLDALRVICVPLGAKPTLAKADALAERLAAMTAAPPVFPAGLSSREIEVLRLLASGKTNREIAETLFLSERTIDAHVRNIFTKTRTDNRAAATAFAYQHRLA